MKKTATLISSFGNLGTSVKIILTLLFLNFFVQRTSAQIITVDGNASDWANFPNAHVQDIFNAGNTDPIFAGNEKDFFFASNWFWKLGGAKDKNEIANGAAMLVTNLDTGSVGAGTLAHLTGKFLVFAGDRTSNNGDAQIGFWFFQNGTAPVEINGVKTFSPEKHDVPTPGDILVLADFRNGGRNALVTVLQWTPGVGTYPNSNNNFTQIGAAAAVAENNGGFTPVPTGWLFDDKQNSNPSPTTQYSPNEFYEGFVDLSIFGANAIFCPSTFLLETRSTHEITSTLDDFIGGALAGTPDCSITGNNTICSGSSTCFSASGGTGSFTYSWTGPGGYTAATAQACNITAGGTYKVTVTNATGCTSSCSRDLTVNNLPTAGAGPDQAKCQTPPTGPTSFTLAGTGTNGTFAWTQVGSTGGASASITSPTSLTSTVSVSGIGTVTLRLTTTSNATPSCGTATDDVVLTVNANPTANAGPDEAKCQTPPTGPTSFTLAGQGSNGTFAWTQTSATGTASASITSPTSLTSAVSVSGIGTVTLKLTTTSNASPSCGTATDEVILTVNANPTANAGPDEAKCQTAPSGPTAFTLAGVGANGTFNWTQVSQTGTAQATIATPGSLTSGVSVAGIGTVTLKLTTTSNASPSCGTATDNVVLTVNANPTANAGPDETKCQTAPSGPTAFTLAGTGANGTFNWTQVSQTGTAQATIATPGSLTSGVSVAGIGTVTLRLTTTSNATPACGTATDDVILTVNANPTANAGPDDSKCQTAPSGPTAFTLAGIGANGTFNWTQVGQTGTAQATIATPGSLTSGVSVAGIGTVTLRLTTTSNATPSCGTATDDVILTVTSLPTANAGPDQTLCQTPPSGPTAFTLAGSGSNGTVSWAQTGATGTANASITTPSSLTSGVSVSGIGSVTLKLTISSASCGTATDEVVLVVNANPTANAGPDQAKCQTPPTGPTSFTLAGTGSNGTFAWTQTSATGTASASITTPTSLTSTVSVSGIGTVTLKLTTTSNANPSCGTATDEVILTVNANPAANAGPDQTLCQTAPSGPTAFTLAGTGSGGTFGWAQISQTGTAQATIATPGSLTSGVSVAGIGTVTLRLTTTSNANPSCGTATDDVILTVNANPTANAGPDDTKCQTAPSGPTAFTLAGTGSGGTFNWTQVSQTGTAQATIATPGSLTSGVSVAGIGTVTLKLTTTSNANPSCGTATDNVVLTVNANPTANAGTDQSACRVLSSAPNVLPAVFGTNTFSVTGTPTNGVPATPAWAVVANAAGYTVNIVSPNSLTTNVQISGNAINGGSVTLRFFVNSNATPSCGTATDDVVLTLNPLPLVKEVVGSAFCPNVTTTGSVTLKNSQVGVSYQLKDDGNNSVDPPKAGTGSDLVWTNLPEGTYTVLGTFVATSCNSSSGPGTVVENPVPEVTITPVADQCNEAGVPCVTLSALPAGGTFTGQGVSNGQFCPAGLAPGTYTVTYCYTNASGCSDCGTIDIDVISCADQICTYTQGAYGNAGGLSCDGTVGGLTTIQIINQALGNWPGSSLKIGVSQTVPTNIQNYVQINDADAQCIIDKLPGGGQATEIIGAHSICSLPDDMLKNGRIKNVLLAQTITLGLNIGITSPSDLGNYHLQAGTLSVAKPVGGCGSNTPKLRKCNYDPVTHLLTGVENEYKTRTFSQALINAIVAAGYPQTIQGLFGLANDALGNKDGVVGSERGLDLSTIGGAAGAINELFDECVIPIGWNVAPCPPSNAPAPARITVTANAEATMIDRLKVSAFPNPFRDQVRFVIESPIAGQAILDVYNLAGQKVQTLFSGHIDANEIRTVDYRPGVPVSGMLIYNFRVGNRIVTGKLVGLKP